MLCRNPSTTTYRNSKIMLVEVYHSWLKQVNCSFCVIWQLKGVYRIGIKIRWKLPKHQTSWSLTACGRLPDFKVILLSSVMYSVNQSITCTNWSSNWANEARQLWQLFMMIELITCSRISREQCHTLFVDHLFKVWGPKGRLEIIQLSFHYK